MKRIFKLEMQEVYRDRPMPFPGVYPTRWKILFEYKDASGVKRRFYYDGKPNAVLTHQLRKVFAKHRSYAAVIEYDRGGLFRYALVGCPNAGFRWNFTTSLAQFYYPDASAGDLGWAWGGNPVKRVLVIYKGRRYMTYWKNAPGLENLARLKQWLPKSGLKFK